MKKWLILVFILTSLAISKSLLAEEQDVVFLELPANFFAQTCPTPIWKNLKVQWLGTADRRSQQEVGLETKKHGKDPVAVTTLPSLASFVDGKLHEIFTRCGMSLVTAPETSEIKLSATIEEFHAGVEKGIILGKGKAKSRMSFAAEAPHRKINASVGYEIEFKKTKKKSLQRLTETLNELLAKTLEQIPTSPQLRNLNEIPSSR